MSRFAFIMQILTYTIGVDGELRLRGYHQAVDCWLPNYFVAGGSAAH